MFTQVFAVIELVLRFFKAWDAFLDFLAEKHAADLEARIQARNQAIDDSKKADSDDDIWKSQDGIVTNTPRP